MSDMTPITNYTRGILDSPQKSEPGNASTSPALTPLQRSDVMTNDTRSPLTARPTTYKGIKMRSRLEAKYAAWLDQQGFEWVYEPRCFAHEGGQYLPDFQITATFVGRPRLTFIEVKPIWERARESYIESIASIIWASEPDALVVVEIQEAERPLVRLPESWGVGWSFDCEWVADAPNPPYLGFTAAMEWRES